MSHIEEGKTSLVFAEVAALLRRSDTAALAQHPCMALLRQALTLVAQHYAGEVCATYRNYWQEEQPTNTGLALRIPLSPQRPRDEALPRGIGLVIDEQTGVLTFLGDPWGVKTQFYQQVQQAIIQRYTVLAHMAALQHLHYHVTAQESEGRVLITGVTYA